jgi:hypothetical protein
LGYAQFPGGTASTDGVVIGPEYFGSSDYGTNFFLAKPYDKGRTGTHEVGHWMNLRHIWGDATCGNDFVADTPAATSANYSCPSYPKVGCSNNMMTMNYMDYTDDACMYMFTTGQRDRMRAIFAAGGARASFAPAAARNEIELAANSSVELYPNPTSGVSTLKLNLANETNSVSVNVIDAMGRVVYSYENRAAFTTKLEHDINLSTLNRGIYFVNVVTDNLREVKKLVVQ